MSESQNHIALVQVAYNYIKEEVHDSCWCLIECDSATTGRPLKVINGFIPDVYYCYQGKIVIGEAKTEADFDRRHSQEQYHSYMVEMLSYGENATMVIAVPWNCVMTAKNYFRRLKGALGYQGRIIVLNEIGGRFVV